MPKSTPERLDDSVRRVQSSNSSMDDADSKEGYCFKPFYLSATFEVSYANNYR